MPSHQGSNSVCSSPASCTSGDPSSPTENSGHRSGRQRLRPWLEEQVDSGKHPGVCWVDKSRSIFRMTWKHSGRSDWSEQDGSIFKAWALHTGRYREGVDTPEWPTWKTRLRCAINKQKPDIQEIKALTCTDEPYPYRVFQFTNRRDTGSNSPPQADSPESVSVSVADSEVDGFRHPVQIRPSVIQTNSGNIPTIISDSLESKPSIERTEECVDAEITSLGSDLRNVSITDLVPTSGISMTNISYDSSSNINIAAEDMETDSLKDVGSRPHHQPQSQSVKMEPQNASYFQTTAGDSELQITLRFRNEVILQRAVTNPHGCRVFYGQSHHAISGIWDAHMFGSEEAEQIVVPYSPGQLRSAQQDEYTRKVLNGFELGISVFMDEQRNIYFERRCKTRIITAPANKGGDHLQHTKKMDRHERLKVFDFASDFLPAFMRYQRGEGPRPSPQVIVAVGQDFHTDVEPYTNLFFSVTVCHAQASDLLSQFTASTSAPEMSRSDQFDHFLNLVRVTPSPTTTTTSPSPTTTTTVTQQPNGAIPLPVYHDNIALM